MPETFFILLAGGILLAAGVSDPKQVALQWLRLCGILALAMAGLSAFFLFRRAEPVGGAVWIAVGAIGIAILAQLALVQTDRRSGQQICAWITFFLAIKVGVDLTKAPLLVAYASAIGIAAMAGL